tara:strand:- start:698 stop:901 length:204 start_codon:yes stop_codon:yes gene_type:complete
MIIIIGIFLGLAIWRLWINSQKVKSYRLGRFGKVDLEDEFEVSESLDKKIKEYQAKNAAKKKKKQKS